MPAGINIHNLHINRPATSYQEPCSLKLPITQCTRAGIVAPGFTLDVRMSKLALGSLDDPPRRLGWREAVQRILGYLYACGIGTEAATIAFRCCTRALRLSRECSVNTIAKP